MISTTKNSTIKSISKSTLLIDYLTNNYPHLTTFINYSQNNEDDIFLNLINSKFSTHQNLSIINNISNTIINSRFPLFIPPHTQNNDNPLLSPQLINFLKINNKFNIFKKFLKSTKLSYLLN